MSAYLALLLVFAFGFTALILADENAAAVLACAVSESKGWHPDRGRKLDVSESSNFGRPRAGSDAGKECSA